MVVYKNTKNFGYISQLNNLLTNIKRAEKKSDTVQFENIYIDDFIDSDFIQNKQNEYEYVRERESVFA